MYDYANALERVSHPSLPPQSKSEPHLALAAILRAGDSREAVQTAHRAVRVEAQVRDVAARVAETRTVGHVERFHAELRVHLPRQLKLPEHAQVPRRNAGPAQDVEGSGAEARVGDR